MLIADTKLATHDSRSPTRMRCEYWLDCPWPLTKPVLMYGTPPMLVTLLLSFVSTRPPLNDLFAFFQSKD